MSVTEVAGVDIALDLLNSASRMAVVVSTLLHYFDDK